MRIGIFGGTFDPVHFGHLILAEQGREQAGLDRVWFVPAARPPHKDTHDIAPFERRAEMLRLALAGAPLFEVCTIEAERPGPNYTADTLDALHARHPEHEWFLLVGSDSLLDLPHWHEPARILNRAGLVVMARPGHPVPDAAATKALVPGAALRHLVVDVPQIDLSSRDLRARLRTGRSVRFMVPRAVEVYLAERELYKAR